MAEKIYGDPDVVANGSLTLGSYVILDDESIEYTGDDATYIPYVTDITYGIVAMDSPNPAYLYYDVVCGNKKDHSMLDFNGATFTIEETFSNVNSNKITFTVYDEDGKSVSQTITLDRVNYIKPTCSLDVNMTTDGIATLRISGAYFNDTFGEIDNDLTVQYRYKESGGSFTSWKTVNPSLSSKNYNASVQVSGLDYQKTYEFQARATDEFFTDDDSTNGKSTPVFDWSATDFNFNVPVTAKGHIYLNGANSFICSGAPGKEEDPLDQSILDCTSLGYLTINNGNYNVGQGTTEIFGYDLISLLGGDMTIHSDSDIALETDYENEGFVRINGEKLDFESGSWSPKAYDFTRDEWEGNYVRFGDICIVNFFLEGETDDYYSEFSIYNLPYAPDGTRWWAGGGNLSGHYVNENWVFSGWVVEADGDIYARASAVGTEDAQNKSSSYCGYDTGRTIIASGTIMYRIDPDEIW